MFAFSPPKSYGDSHPVGGEAKPGALPGKQAPALIPTPVDAVNPETVGLAPQSPKVL